MTPEKRAALRAIGPFPALQIAAPRDDDDTIDLLSHPANVTPGGPVGALAYHGGPTLTAPKLVALYAGAFYGDRATNDQFLTEVMAYGYLSGLVNEGSGNGVFLGSYNVPLAATHVSDADCQTLIADALASDKTIPRPEPETIYMLILPDGVSVGDGTAANSSCTAFCGYHSSTAAFLYTIQPATTCASCHQQSVQDALQMVEAHEIAESCTDPHGTGWYNDQTGEENADECAWVAAPFGPWTVQGYAAQNAAGQWINTVGAYVVPGPPQPQPQPGPQPQASADGLPLPIPDGFDATLPFDAWVASAYPALFAELAGALPQDKAAIVGIWAKKVTQLSTDSQWRETVPFWVWIDAQPETAAVLRQAAQQDQSGRVAAWIDWMEQHGYLTAAA